MTRLCYLLAAGLWAVLPAHALEYLAVSTPAAITYDAPSVQAKKLFVLGRDFPVEVVVSVDKWVKVRDYTGALAWIEKAQLGDKRMLVVTLPAEIHAAAQDAAAVLTRADKGSLLEWQETLPGGWVKVRLPNNASGYIRQTQVWGA